MRMTVIYDKGKPVGYILHAESPQEHEALKEVQDMHFLANNKQQRIQYDGVCTSRKRKVLNVHFLQRQYALLPPESEVKQELIKCSLQSVSEENQK